MKDKFFKFSTIAFIIASIIVFAYFIWPTPWKDIKITEVPYSLADYETDIEKTNRFSGDQCEIAEQDIDRVYVNGVCWIIPAITILLTYIFVTLFWVACFNIDQKKKITNMMQLGNVNKASFYLRQFFRGTISFIAVVFVLYLSFYILYMACFFY